MKVEIVKPCTHKGKTYPVGAVIEVTLHESLKLVDRGLAKAFFEVSSVTPPVVEEAALPHDDFESSVEV